MTASGELYDLGYQRYLGPREGRSRARKALWTSGVRTTLGLGRGARSKVLPTLLVVSALAPALLLTAVASIVGSGGDVPGHAGYYQIISIVLILFSAIMAPELLCPDRRDRVIDLYLVRPLTATDYVIARWLAFLAVTLAIVYAGQVVLLIGFTLAAPEPLQYLRDNWLDVPRFLLAGLVIAVFTTTLPMAVSAFTTRRAYAAAFVIGLYLIAAPVAGVLTECIDFDDERQRAPGRETCEPLTGDAAKWFALVNIGQAPGHVNALIFDEELDRGNARIVDELPTAVPVAWYLVLVAGPGLVLLWRYSRIGS